MAQITYAPNPVKQEKVDNSLTKALTVAGMVAGGTIGASTGGPAGAVGGASAGAGAGNAIGGLVAKDPEPVSQAPQAPSVGGQDGAMSRRLSELENGNLMQIRKSLDALKGQPPEAIAAYAPPLLMAEQKARMG